MIVRPIKTRIFKEGEDLAAFILEHLKRVPERSVLAVTSKIVALAEGRTAPRGGKRRKEKIIKEESEWAFRAKHVWLTMKDGMLMANAGVDESNARGALVLLPKDSYKAAASLRRRLQKELKVKKFGILITDSRTLPLRVGVIGIALGYAGFRGVKDYRGAPDLFGRRFRFSRGNTADGLAAAAVLAMGEGRERTPLALVADAGIKFSNAAPGKEIIIPGADDMYRPILKFPE